MQVTIIRYHRLINLGNYENENMKSRLPCKKAMIPTPSPQAKTLVEQFLAVRLIPPKKHLSQLPR